MLGIATLARLGSGELMAVGTLPSALAHLGERFDDWQLLDEGIAHAAAGPGFLCTARAGSDEVRCVGDSPLHRGSGVPWEEEIARPSAPGGTVRQLVVGAWHVCVLMEDGILSCAGSNGHGQLGGADLTYYSDRFAQVTDIPPMSRVIAGTWHMCGLAMSGEVWCWGLNDYGATSRLATEDTLPVRIDLGAPASRLVGDTRRTCALTREGEAICWGDLTEIVGGSNLSEPIRVDALGRDVVDIVQRRGYACAAYGDGRLRCFSGGEPWPLPPLEAEADDWLDPGVPVVAFGRGRMARWGWDGREADTGPLLVTTPSSELWLIGEHHGTLGTSIPTETPLVARIFGSR